MAADPFDEMLPTDPDATVVGRLLDPALGPCVVTVRDRQFVDLTALVAACRRAAWPRRHWQDVVRHGTRAGGRWHQVSRGRRKPAGTATPTVAHLLAPDRPPGDQGRRRHLRPPACWNASSRNAPGATPPAPPRTSDASTAGRCARSTWHPARVPQPWRSKTCCSPKGCGRPTWKSASARPGGLHQGPGALRRGPGAEVGVLGASVWNNPEPEVVLVANCRGRCVGATLGNDVIPADYVIISPGLGAVRGTSATVNPTATTTYKLYATNQYGRTTATVTVTVP